MRQSRAIQITRDQRRDHHKRGGPPRGVPSLGIVYDPTETNVL